MIQRKVLKGTHLPVEIKEMQARYLNSSHFKDIYLYLSQNKLPTSKTAIRKVEMLAEGYKFILCIIDEVTNYLVTVPIYQAKSEEIGEAIIENMITKHCIPEYIIMDQDSAFMSLLMMYLLTKFNIKIRTVASYNYHSLQAEHSIKSLSTILTKHLTNLGQMWPKYLPMATFAYNTFNIPNLGNYSPYE